MNTPLPPDLLAADATSISPRARLVRPVLLFGLPLLTILAGGGTYLLGGRYVETDNAYVQADKLPVSAEISGTVSQVLVRENEKVAVGQVLLRIDPQPFQIKVNKAEAKLAQVLSDLAALKAGYHEKQAEIALNRTRAYFSRKEQRRQAALLSKHYISVATFDDARQASDLAGQQIAMLEQDLQRIAATLGGSVDTPSEQHPSYRAALAELDSARLNLARTEVRAALPGTVSNLPKPGQYLTAGNIAMALIASHNLWIAANYPETDLTFVRPGQPVNIHIDTFPGLTWRGHVESLSPATGAEFSVIPAQNATGNWVKIVQRVPVRISLQQEAGQPPLLAGLSSVVEIDTGHRRSLLGWSL